MPGTPATEVAWQTTATKVARVGCRDWKGWVHLKKVEYGHTGLRLRAYGKPPRWTGTGRSRSGASQPWADRGRVWVAATLFLTPV